MGSREIPVVDAMRCTGSGECVDACPTDCLEMRDQLPALARPHDCISCGLCAAVCPVTAIQIASRWCA